MRILPSSEPPANTDIEGKQSGWIEPRIVGKDTQISLVKAHSGALIFVCRQPSCTDYMYFLFLNDKIVETGRSASLLGIKQKASRAAREHTHGYTEV